jgi:DNA-directed RNA polymerase subunit RPC12/RpoP
MITNQNPKCSRCGAVTVKTKDGDTEKIFECQNCFTRMIYELIVTSWILKKII